MKIIVTETQYNLIKELSSNSNGVKEFLEMVKSTKGLLKHLGFKNMKSLEEFIRDGHINDLYELKRDAEKFTKESDKK